MVTATESGKTMILNDLPNCKNKCCKLYRRARAVAVSHDELRDWM